MTPSFPTRRSSDLRLGVRELDSIEGPGEFLHMPGEVQLDGATWLTPVRIREGAAQVRVREDASAVVSQTNTWVVQLMRWRSEEHTSELQSLMRISYDVFCLKKKKIHKIKNK